MEKTLWLHNVMVKMLNNPDTALGNAYQWLCRVGNIKECAIYLRELYSKNGSVILIKNHVAQIYSQLDVECQKYREILDDITASHHFTAHHGLRAFPMTCAKSDYFGTLICNVAQISDEDLQSKAFSVFCDLTYSEIMGGFLKSDNPVVMKLENVCMNYHHNAEGGYTVNDVSLTIHKGELTLIMGRSGCGKSTLLNIMGGMITPTSGSVYFNGTNICTFTERQRNDYRRNDLGFIFQNYNLLGDLTAMENVSIAASLAKNAYPPLDILRQVGLVEKSHCYPGKMSGGEQQRVCIARALVKHTGILLCDEPTGALDTDNAKNVMTILQKTAKEQNIPVVVVTHNPEFSYLADHYIEMKNGVIIEDDYRPFPLSVEQVL